jgi:hypothetical protein
MANSLCSKAYFRLALVNELMLTANNSYKNNTE